MRIYVWDTTLRDGEQAPGFALNPAQKVEAAKYLEEIGVDTIEAGMPANQEHDFPAIQAISQAVQKVEVAAFVRAASKDIELAARALEKAKNPVVQTFTPAYEKKLIQLGWTPEQGLEYAVQSVRNAKKYVDTVCFGAEFSTKADRQYLSQLFQAVVNEGASRIVVADTTGYALPDQFKDLVRHIKETVKGDYRLSVHCHNDIGQAVANALKALESGATEVQATVNGIGERAGNTSLETLYHALQVRSDIFSVETNINPKVLVENAHRIARIFGFSIQPNAPVTGKNAFSTAAGIHIQGGNIYLEINPEEIYGLKPGFIAGPHSGRFRG